MKKFIDFRWFKKQNDKPVYNCLYDDKQKTQ
jgi:hypothetical protein